MSKRLRIKLNLLVRRKWSKLQLTDLFTSTILLLHTYFCNFPIPFIDLVYFQKSILIVVFVVVVVIVTIVVSVIEQLLVESNNRFIL